MEQSYVMLKPGYAEKENEIMERLLRETGAGIIRRGRFALSEELLCEHYAHIVNFDFFTQSVNGKPSMKEYMLSGDVVGFVLEGEDGLVERIRKSIGATKATDMGTIRYDFIADRSYSPSNVIHASGSAEEAEQEIKRFAPFLSKWKKK